MQNEAINQRVINFIRVETGCGVIVHAQDQYEREALQEYLQCVEDEDQHTHNHDEDTDYLYELSPGIKLVFDVFICPHLLIE